MVPITLLNITAGKGTGKKKTPRVPEVQRTQEARGRVAEPPAPKNTQSSGGYTEVVVTEWPLGTEVTLPVLS